MVGLGVLHFVIGRYCNFKANQVAGVNLTAPVIQLQVVVTMVLAVVILHEPCTALQIDRRRADAGGFADHAAAAAAHAGAPRRRTEPAQRTQAVPLFVPRYLAGYLFALLAALSYGTTPIMARFALAHTGPATGILGGLIAYIAATAVAALALLSAPIRRNVLAVNRSNARWFITSGVLVAAAQGFFFCAVAVAPVLLVMPLLQLSLAFRMLFSTWLSPDHEVFGPLVVVGRGHLDRRGTAGLDRHRRRSLARWPFRMRSRRRCAGKSEGRCRRRRQGRVVGAGGPSVGSKRATTDAVAM